MYFPLRCYPMSNHHTEMKKQSYHAVTCGDCLWHFDCGLFRRHLLLKQKYEPEKLKKWEKLLLG